MCLSQIKYKLKVAMERTGFNLDRTGYERTGSSGTNTLGTNWYQFIFHWNELVTVVRTG